ncbi:MAG: hypothetical protein J6O49_14485 [Bacteroidaceae bacterium]|nr:hypothetical protein [Bacteroidaceae bacterium]
MASEIEKTLNRVGNAVQSLFSGKDEPTVSNTNANTGQTCLEITGMRQRELHLRQNAWRREYQEYSKPLVDAEYNIQTEFLVSSTDDLIQEQKQKQEEREAKAAAKKEAKRKKKEEKLKKKEEKAAGRQKDDKGNNIKPEPYENIKDFQNNRSNDDAIFSNYGYEMA